MPAVMARIPQKERNMTYEQHGAAIQAAIDTLLATVTNARTAGHVVKMDVTEATGMLNVRVYRNAESAAAKMQIMAELPR